MSGGGKQVLTRAEREGAELVSLLDQGTELGARPRGRARTKAAAPRALPDV